MTGFHWLLRAGKWLSNQDGYSLQHPGMSLQGTSSPPWANASAHPQERAHAGRAWESGDGRGTAPRRSLGKMTLPVRWLYLGGARISLGHLPVSSLLLGELLLF